MGLKTTQIALFAAMAMMIIACKKDAETPPPPGVPESTTATVRISYDFVNGGQAFDHHSTFTDAHGRKVGVTLLKFYAYDVLLTDDASATVADLRDRIMLVNAIEGGNNFELGTMDPAHVHNVNLSFGLDSASSYGFADQATAPAPLNDPGMTWMWNVANGRMFIRFEGFLDANDNGMADDGEGFEYHGIGHDMVAVHWHEHIHTDVVAGGTFTIGLKVDMSTLVHELALDGMYHNDGPETLQLMQSLAAATSPL